MENTQYNVKLDRKMDTIILNNIIIGRVEPHIYAFSTQTVPNYLKVGDTYRPIEQRLNEWRKYFPNLEKEFSDVAKVDDETYFRDFAIHYYLEQERNLKRLMPGDIANLPYYSKEFFENASVQDVKDALTDIKECFDTHSNKYQFYSFDNSRVPITYTYERVDNYPPRPNQTAVIENFKKATAAGRNNLLMYAVMRFGKSFTSMCCATEMNEGKGANLVVVVSAKADVKQEWKKTVESHVRFKDYIFMDSDSLLADENALFNKLKTNHVVVFLTLQDLMGDDIKAKHKQIFDSQFDLLIVDESHYGARASEYGKVLRVTNTQLKNELLETDSADEYENNETLKTLRSKVRLHLSGTPYRILMGDEFTKDDIIAFYQFTDIVKDQENWNNKYLLGDDVKEWDNPYYGFPQMIRFAFNPNESSVKKMEELKKIGITYAFSELFRPQSILKDTSLEHKHKKFVNEQEVLDLLKVIDGTKTDENILSFLDYDKIKDGKMCRHIVCVLPYRASCDALEALITENKDKFKNLKDYEIINIAGVDDERTYKDTTAVKEKINECESNDKKTLTLTVNRMLTGSTVEQWDTMLYLKDTASPQEYDQAIFRLQNQYIRKYKDDKGDVIKYNMKPQTLLVDFNPNRMFHLQEQKSQIYNVNVDKNGNSKLKDRIKEELRVSPIIIANKDKMREIVPEDILDAVREYSADKSVIDEATDIPIDSSLLTDETIRKEIEELNPIDSSKGIDIKAAKGEGDDVDSPDDEESDDQTKHEDGNPSTPNDKEEEDDSLDKKLATYYAQILFFAFLTDSNVKSLEEIINVIDDNDDNQRLARNVGLRVSILKIIQKKSNPFILSKLDYKIQNLNTLMKDTSLQPDERVEVAMKKFGRLSSSEIVTPMKIAKEMVDILPEKEIKENARILDIASKQGEFTLALYNKFGDKIKTHIYAIPTSTITYEFTRKVYSLLGMPIENVFSKFNSYDLINKDNKETIIMKLTNMKFDVIIGNPPYQDRNVGEQKTFNPAIYNDFIDIAYDISKLVVMIHPARFLFNAGSTKKSWNKQMLNNSHIKVAYYEQNSNKVFDKTDIKGGICVTVYDKSSTVTPIGTFTPYPEVNSILRKVISREDFVPFSNIVITRTAYRFTEKMHQEHPEAITQQSEGHPYDVSTNIFERIPQIFFDEKPKEKNDYICILGRINNNRIYKYIQRDYVRDVKNLDSYKLFMSSANGTGIFGESLTPPIIEKPGIGSTETFISIGNFKTIKEATATSKYVCSKFVRSLLGILKRTHHISPEVWKYVPLQNFSSKSDINWNKPVHEIDRQLYAKYHLSKSEIEFVEHTVKEMR